VPPNPGAWLATAASRRAIDRIRRVALTLRLVGGLTVAEIARAFLMPETTVGQRITRAKAKIKAARIPYRVPSRPDLEARVSGVLAVLFLVFNEGYLATGPDTDPVRHDLVAEAIRLTGLIAVCCRTTARWLGCWR
jgi:RNA polymerase sigma-70 factor, ECF subfamily